jgi:hypothetical protein
VNQANHNNRMESIFEIMQSKVGSLPSVQHAS